MDQDDRSQKLNEMKLTLAVLSVQFDAAAIRRGHRFLSPSLGSIDKVSQNLALRAVLAMRNGSEHQYES
ncbi:hypothetical protein [Bradyrhizobium sp. WSM1417]|jgi:hypothetical protein|uniref:hypothetical protein n=1 Tax=Bradyrhizobium sp. WSM1417 TaxID=754500 RepID=UPI000483D4AA|nr:hypothetical protein [Bradyrhizobium sp. WSM1417]